MKPRITREESWPLLDGEVLDRGWQCRSEGRIGFGDTPREAYWAWVTFEDDPEALMGDD